MSRGEKRHIIARIGFLIYSIIMLWLLFGQRVGTPLAYSGVNLAPFSTIGQYVRLLRTDFARTAYVNLVGNTVLFVPLGIFLPWIWRRLRGFFKTLGIVLAAIIAVEALQYLTGLGTCDVDDVILNISGAAIGYGLYKIVR